MIIELKKQKTNQKMNPATLNSEDNIEGSNKKMKYQLKEKVTDKR